MPALFASQDTLFVDREDARDILASVINAPEAEALPDDAEMKPLPEQSKSKKRKGQKDKADKQKPSEAEVTEGNGKELDVEQKALDDNPKEAPKDPNMDVDGKNLEEEQKSPGDAKDGKELEEEQKSPGDAKDGKNLEEEQKSLGDDPKDTEDAKDGKELEEEQKKPDPEDTDKDAKFGKELEEQKKPVDPKDTDKDANIEANMHSALDPNLTDEQSDKIDWEALASFAREHSLFLAYEASVRKEGGLSEEDWHFGDPDGDVLEDIRGLSDFIAQSRAPLAEETAVAAPATDAQAVRADDQSAAGAAEAEKVAEQELIEVKIEQSDRFGAAFLVGEVIAIDIDDEAPPQAANVFDAVGVQKPPSPPAPPISETELTATTVPAAEEVAPSDVVEEPKAESFTEVTEAAEKVASSAEVDQALAQLQKQSSAKFVKADDGRSNANAKMSSLKIQADQTVAAASAFAAASKADPEVVEEEAEAAAEAEESSEEPEDAQEAAESEEEQEPQESEFSGGTGRDWSCGSGFLCGCSCYWYYLYV